PQSPWPAISSAFPCHTSWTQSSYRYLGWIDWQECVLLQASSTWQCLRSYVLAMAQGKLRLDLGPVLQIPAQYVLDPFGHQPAQANSVNFQIDPSATVSDACTSYSA